MTINLARKTQIVLLLAKEVKITAEYLDFSNIFSKIEALMLLAITHLNQYALKLQKSQQLLYGLIYNLGLVKFKILKTYIENNLTIKN